MLCGVKVKSEQMSLESFGSALLTLVGTRRVWRARTPCVIMAP